MHTAPVSFQQDPVDAALEVGLNEIGFSDHSPMAALIWSVTGSTSTGKLSPSARTLFVASVNNRLSSL